MEKRPEKGKIRTSIEQRKFVRPALPCTIYHRASLCTMMQKIIEESTSKGSFSYKLTLLCAPAGYGKTTLLADLSMRSSIAWCWYFLDQSDNDPFTFLQNLLTCLRQQFPTIALPLARDLQERVVRGSSHTEQLFHWLETLITTLDTEIEHKMVLCLCDYYKIRNKQINDLLNRLLEILPQNCHVVLESRAIPHLNFPSLLAQRRMHNFGSNDLYFTIQDIKGLGWHLQKKPLSEEEATYLSTMYDGWITGLLLGTRWGEIQYLAHVPSSLSRGSPALRIDQHVLYTYFSTEVFREEAEIFLFLKDLSILEELEPDFCNTLLAIEDSQKRLLYAEQRGLFVTYQEKRDVYCCHPFLRRLLYEKLCQEEEEYAHQLHLRAAQLFLAANAYKQAIEHAFAAGDNDFAANVIRMLTLHDLLGIDPTRIAYWLDLLPAQLIDSHPHLLIMQAKQALLSEEKDIALSSFEKAYLLLNTRDPKQTQMKGAILLEMSRIHYERGNYTQVQQWCQEALLTVSVEEERVWFYYYLGICKSQLGDYLAGIPLMQQTLYLLPPHIQDDQFARCSRDLGYAYTCTGNFSLALHHYQRARACYQKRRDREGENMTLIGLAFLELERGNRMQAEELLDLVIMHPLSGDAPQIRATALLVLGKIHLDQGLSTRALIVIEESLTLARQQGNTYLINKALCGLALAYLGIGDTHTASLLIRQVNMSLIPNTGYEWIEYELILSTILFSQQKYRDAYNILYRIKSSTFVTQIKTLQPNLLICLAACQLELGKREELLCSLESISTLITEGYNKQKIITTLNSFPRLCITMQKTPPLAGLWQGIDEQDNRSATQQTLTSFKSRRNKPEKIKLRILAFGEPTIFKDEQQVTNWRMARAMELYFFLLDQARLVRKDQIIEALWPHSSNNLDQRFRSTLHYLRKALGNTCIVYQAGKYGLHLTPYQIWYDVEVFERCLVLGRQALESEEYEKAYHLLREAYNLYRGDYVHSFYSNWCIGQRDRLRESYMNIQRELALIAWQQGHLNECKDYWEGLLTIDKCLEEAYYGLMLSALQKGRRSEALRQYQRCVENLKKDLSIAPSPAIQQLYHSLIHAQHEALPFPLSRQDWKTVFSLERDALWPHAR